MYEGKTLMQKTSKNTNKMRADNIPSDALKHGQNHLFHYKLLMV